MAEGAGEIQIETYVRTENEQEFGTVIDRYGKLLSSLGFDPEEVTHKLAELTWEQLDNDESPVLSLPHVIETADCTLHVAASIIGFNKEIIPDDWHWLELILFMAIDEVTWSPDDYRYRDNCVHALWELVKRYSEIFQEIGVYVTDPVGEGRTWEALVHGKSGESWLWSFDLALVPHHLADRVKNPPAKVESAAFDFGLALIDTDKLRVFPWRS